MNLEGDCWATKAEAVETSHLPTKDFHSATEFSFSALFLEYILRLNARCLPPTLNEGPKNAQLQAYPAHTPNIV